MPTSIKCPKCANEFDIEDVLYSEVEQKIKTENQEILRSELQAVQAEKDKLSKERQDFDEKKKKENELFAQKVQQEKEKMTLDIRKEVEKESGNKIKFLEEQTANADIKIKKLEEKELEALRLKNENDELKRNAENEKKKYLLENTPKIIKDALSKEKEQFDLEKKTLELKLDQQKRLIEEMERKVNQGSMQTQGEVQEKWLFDALKSTFPFDIIEDISTGKRGADIIMTIRNGTGIECGKIYFESKRTKDWSNSWIDKFKQDMRNIGAEVGLLVTQVLPKDIEKFGEKEGIYVCNLTESLSLASILRNAVIKVFEIRKSQENKGDKMVALYDYLTGNEFIDNWKAMRERFNKLKDILQKERENFEINWKRKEKLINLIILGSAQITGSIQGISGMDSVDLNLLPSGDDDDDMAH